MKIEIDQSSCIRCGKCIRICPATLFDADRATKEIHVSNVEHCIGCGHCVAICPTNSIEHSTFPESTVHAFNRTALPTAESVELLIKSRRSNRSFSSKAVPKEFLEKILEAAHRAPTASNEQELEYTVVTDPEKLHQISAATLEVFEDILKKIRPVKGLVKLFAPEVIALIPQFEEMLADFANGKDRILRHAKAVILIHTSPKARFGKQDANLAYQNASLMAESLNVAQFYTGFVCVANDNDSRKRRLNKLLGIEGKIHAGMALGMPSLLFEKFIDRNQQKINWI